MQLNVQNINKMRVCETDAIQPHYDKKKLRYKRIKIVNSKLCVFFTIFASWDIFTNFHK